MSLLRGRMETSSLLGLPISRLAGSNSRRFRHTFACAIHSHLLAASPLSASSLSPFSPCTPTFDSQSPAVGECCHSCTWRVGIDKSSMTCRTYMDTQLSKIKATFAAHPPSQRTVSSERIAERGLGGSREIIALESKPTDRCGHHC
jgi:hypothetical protein